MLYILNTAGSAEEKNIRPAAYGIACKALALGHQQSTPKYYSLLPSLIFPKLAFWKLGGGCLGSPGRSGTFGELTTLKTPF